MKRYLSKQSAMLLGVVVFMLLGIVVRAQEKIEIDKEEIGSWFERHWMWVVAGVVLVLLIALLSRGGSARRKTTTVIKDAHGKTKSVTTVEEET